MKYIITVVTTCFLFFSATSFAQSKDLLDRMAVHKEIIRLYKAEKWDSVIKIGAKVPVRDSFYLYSFERILAKAYLHTGDTAKAMKRLTNAVRLQEIGELDQMAYQFADFKLGDKKPYKDIIQNFDALHDHYSGRLNGKMMRDCLEIFYTDQRLRNIWWPYMRDTITGKKLELAMNMSDSMNIKALMNIFRTHGRYPGISDLGPSFAHNFTYIVSHMSGALDKDTLYNCLHAAVLNGQVTGGTAAYILDKAELWNGRPTLYSEHGTASNFIDGVYHYSDVQDPEHLDKRRAALLLPPLYEVMREQRSAPPKGYDPRTQKN